MPPVPVIVPSNCSVPPLSSTWKLLSLTAAVRFPARSTSPSDSASTTVGPMSPLTVIVPGPPRVSVPVPVMPPLSARLSLAVLVSSEASPSRVIWPLTVVSPVSVRLLPAWNSTGLLSVNAASLDDSITGVLNGLLEGVAITSLPVPSSVVLGVRMIAPLDSDSSSCTVPL